jgi:hypothetical protein
MARKDRKNTNITKVSLDKNTTTGKQFPLRLTEYEQEQLEILMEKVSILLPNKKIAKSTILRSIVYIHDDAFLDYIVSSIKENI